MGWITFLYWRRLTQSFRCRKKIRFPPARITRGRFILYPTAKVDAISICTPNDVHFQMAMDAASARKPYACEKPVTMNALQAKELADHTKMLGVPGMVCFSYRFKAAARYAKDLVQRGTLGNTIELEGIRLKRMAFFNRQKARRVLFAQDLYAAEAADGGYYEANKGYSME